VKKLVSILIMLLGVQANAGFLAEPFIGYDQTTAKTTDVSATDGGSKNSGMDYGARLGFRFTQGYWVAAEYAGGSGTSKSDTTGTADMDYTRTALGAVFGYDYGQFGFWGGYGFSDKLTIKATGSTDTVFAGTNFKVGVGYRPMMHVSVNLEYVIPKYTKVTVNSVETDLSTFYTKFDTSGAMLSVSFPFDMSK
jgi:hypothetical protein